MRRLFLLALVGCVGDLQPICVDNETKQFDLCDLELDANGREAIAITCAEAEGYARSIKCAAEAKQVVLCENEVLLRNPACEDIQDDLTVCAYERGLFFGCRDNNKN